MSISLPGNLFSTASLRLHRLWLLLGFGMVAAIFFFSLTAMAMPDGKHVDKLFHAASYGIVTAWFAQLYPRRVERLLLALAFSLMGVAIEFLQGLHPMRYFDVADMLANTVGALCALLLVSWRCGRLLAVLENWLLGPLVESD